MILVMASGFAFGKDIFFACFIQTFLFVTFNKVCTSQVCVMERESVCVCDDARISMRSFIVTNVDLFVSTLCGISVCCLSSYPLLRFPSDGWDYVSLFAGLSHRQRGCTLHIISSLKVKTPSSHCGWQDWLSLGATVGLW
jgi:hypothetical protein